MNLGDALANFYILELYTLIVSDIIEDLFLYLNQLKVSFVIDTIHTLFIW